MKMDRLMVRWDRQISDDVNFRALAQRLTNLAIKLHEENQMLNEENQMLTEALEYVASCVHKHRCKSCQLKVKQALAKVKENQDV